MDKAIIIPANPRRGFEGGPGIGSIYAHTLHLSKYKAVFWVIIPAGRSKESFKHNVKIGYFYNKIKKAVTHKFEIEYIKFESEIREPNPDIYVPSFRWNDWGMGDWGYYIKIIRLRELKRIHLLSDFKLCSKDKPVRRVQNYAIAWDPNYKWQDKDITKETVVDGYISDFLLSGDVQEQDIENLFEMTLFDESFVIDRQGHLWKKGRFDVAFQDNNGIVNVVEIKKGTADKNTLKQLKGYMSGIKRKYMINKSKLHGVILCKDADPELEKIVKKENKIRIQKYRFSIEFSD